MFQDFFSEEATISEIERRFSMIYMAITREEETRKSEVFLYAQYKLLFIQFNS